MREQYSIELAEACTGDNLLERSRISDAGRFAVGFAKPIQPKSGHPFRKGNPYEAGRWARTAAGAAERLFPELLGDPERYGQQLELLEVA